MNLSKPQSGDDAKAGMQEMARRVDAEDGAKDSGSNSVPMGWVMLSFLSRLQHTGKTRDHSTNEDMKKMNTTINWSPEAEYKTTVGGWGTAQQRDGWGGGAIKVYCSICRHLHLHLHLHQKTW
jgi:hypothetical protein